MSVSFNFIPAALRYPGQYIEIDGSQAGVGDDIPKVLLIGQKLETGTAASGEITLMSSVEDAINKAGAGSDLAVMADGYRSVDVALEVYLLPLADNLAGVQATGTLSITTAANGNGTLSLYIGGTKVSVAINGTDNAAAQAAAIAAAINAAGTKVPVTAAAVADVVTLTARHKGTTGNHIDVRLNVYGEDTPAGLVLAIAAMAGGAGDPDLTNFAQMLGGNRWYMFAGTTINDAANLAIIDDVLWSRFQPPLQQDTTVFTVHRGNYAQALAYGDPKNHKFICNASLGINPIHNPKAVGVLTAAASPFLANNPVRSAEGIKLPGIVATQYHDWTQANSLLFNGMSVIEVGSDGACYIKRLISMYQERPDGSTDDSYLDINTIRRSGEYRNIQRQAANKRFVGTAAAKNNEGYAPGLRITTEDDVRALLLSLYQNTFVREMGRCQDYDFYKAYLVVEQDSTNPSRFNFVDTPVFLSPFYVLAGRQEFRKVAE